MRTSALPLVALLLGLPAQVEAQTVPPTPLPVRGVFPPGLECTAEAANVSAFASADGSLSIFNVPTNQGQVRVRATCKDALGNTVTGQSAPVTPVPGARVSFAGVDFGATVPIAARLTVTPARTRVVGVASSFQLSVGAAFADLTSGDVTLGATGTTYRTSNPAVATVDANGVVKATGPGTAGIFALNEGASGLATVTVLPAELDSLTVTPPSVELVLDPAIRPVPAQLQVTGTLTSSDVIDLTSSSSGTTYSSSDPTIAAVSAGGAIAAVSPGSVIITITDATSGFVAEVPVTVTASSPFASAACDTPGFASSVDVDGALAFVADGASGLQILDTRSCASVGHLDFAGQQAVDVRVRPPLAAVALGAGGVALVNIADPAAPALLAQAPAAGAITDLALSGDRLYAASSSGLAIFDVSTPATPSLLGIQPFSGAARAVAADSARGVAVLLTSEPALQVVQTGGPLPWPVASVPLPSAVNQADDVALLGTLAYVANGRGGVVQIDLTRLDAPVIKATTTLNFDALGVAVQKTSQGTFIAAADDLFVNAIPFFDARLSNTYNLDYSSFPGAIQLDANSNAIALGDGFGVVTVGGAGIQVFRTRQLVDNAGVPPVVSITTPSQGGTLHAGTSAFVSVAASDDVRVASVDFFLDGSLVATDTAAPFNAWIPVPGSGPVTLVARATDLGGNQAESLPVTLDVSLDPNFCPDLQAYWPFGDPGPTEPELIHNNALVKQAGATSCPGVVGQALCLDGSSSASVPDSPPLNVGFGNFSVVGWLRTGAAGGVPVMLDKRVELATVRGYVFYLVNGRLGFQLSDGGFSNYFSPAFVADGQWHHVAVTIIRNDPAGGTFYVDGVAVQQTFNPTGRQGDLTNTSQLTFGSRSTTATGFFPGALDDFRIFTRALSPAEVAALGTPAGIPACSGP